MSRPSPSRESLVEAACRLARELHHINPPESELRERIEYVMWGRKRAWDCLEDGLITEVELRQLLIDHIDYECAHASGHSWPEFDPDARQQFIELIDQLLFGRTAV
ncbi:hypothetical protein [Enhygromyxa salina]|uniref:hypothetical protein n=1 Tax=Enhygromyxa salina TaxID=215803 RepID=UPI0011BA657D|nr:hypothetical protein [Enhygromyxa salina]